MLSSNALALDARSLSRIASPALTPAHVQITDAAIPLSTGGEPQVLTIQSPGTETYSGGGATIDASNSSEGYITVKYSGANPKVKVLISCAGQQYQYNLNTQGQYEAFPLTSGNGSYTIGVYTNVAGTSYATALSRTIQVNLRDPLLPFLYPSQYVNFNAQSSTVAMAKKLAASADTDLAVIQNVYNFVTNNVTYDTQKAQSVTQGQLSGYLPAVDTILASGKGICFDYAAVMASMLRSQGIPTRMEVGYVSGGAYHAWISTYVKEVGWVNGIIQFDGQNWKLMDPTFASSGGDQRTQQYIGTGGNYRTQYIY